jgi:hypothetical protein
MFLIVFWKRVDNNVKQNAQKNQRLVIHAPHFDNHIGRKSSEDELMVS